MKKAEELEAKQEHQSLNSVPLCISLNELIAKVGQGYTYYFHFIKFQGAINVLLSIIALISIIPHLLDLGDRESFSADEVLGKLFVSAYSNDTRGAWLTSSILAVLLALGFGPLYVKLVNFLQEKRISGGTDYVEDPFQGQYNVDTQFAEDRIEYGSVRLSQLSIRLRRCFSITFYSSSPSACRQSCPTT